MIALQQVDHVALKVADLRKSIAWYRDVLGLHRRHEEAWGDRPAMLCAGSTCVALFSGRPTETTASLKAPPEPAIYHLAFRATHADFIAAKSDLTARGIPFQFSDHGIAHSIYFVDPDGHRLEITTYDLPQEDGPTLG